MQFVFIDSGGLPDASEKLLPPLVHEDVLFENQFFPVG
jgi:hypothetical protein